MCVCTTANGFCKTRARQRGGEDKGQDIRRRLDEDQAGQMCGNGNARTEREDDECRLEASAVTASAHSSSF